MDALGRKPATQPHVVIDTSAEPDVEGWGSTQPTESTSNSHQEGSYLITPQQESASATCSCTPWPSSTATCCSTPVSSKKRKHSKTDAFELAMGNVVEKLMEAQSESEARLLEFEEKHMKMEEKERENLSKLKRESSEHFSWL